MSLKRSHLCVIGISLFLFAVLLGNTGCRRPKPFQGYDGTWWAKTPSDQQLGFIDGYVDCYAYGLRNGDKLRKARSWYQSAITRYYDEVGPAKMMVGLVLIRVAEKAETCSFAVWDYSDVASKEGILDGRIWTRYSKKERMGFVEGYLNALMPKSSRGLLFPKSPEYYAEAITRNYAAGNLDQKIGKALWDLRTPPPQ